MADWQPIETAPKDGTRILLWDTDEVVIAKWDDISMGGAEGWQITVVNMLSGLKHYEAAFNPTHWMPLPEPPRDMLTQRCPVTIPGCRRGEDRRFDTRPGAGLALFADRLCDRIGFTALVGLDWEATSAGITTPSPAVPACAEGMATANELCN
jgi:hypothetical protein